MFNFLVALFNPVLIYLSLDILRKSDLKIQTGADKKLYLCATYDLNFLNHYDFLKNTGPLEGLRIRGCQY